MDGWVGVRAVKVLLTAIKKILAEMINLRVV